MKDQSFDFPVSLQPIFTRSGVQVPRARAVVRDDLDRPMSVVSDRYSLYTHKEVMNAVQPFVRELGKSEVSYSLEKEGARLVATHTFKDVSIKVPTGHNNYDGTPRSVGDVIALQINVINSYNRSTSLEFELGGLVLRCLNGMTMFDEFFHLRYAHLAESWDRQLPKPEVIMRALQKTEGKLQQWGEQDLDRYQREELVQTGIKLQLFPKRFVEKNIHRFNNAETVWDLYNAFTYVVTHGSVRMQQSGKLNRFDRVNRLFRSVLEPTAA